MPSAEDITQAVNRYIETMAKGRADDLVDFFADDATLEDPVGGEVHIGRQAIHGFYANVEDLNRESELVTLRVAGNEAAFLFRLTVDYRENRMRIEPIEVQVFDENTKITSMKAYWSPADVTQL